MDDMPALGIPGKAVGMRPEALLQRLHGQNHGLGKIQRETGLGSVPSEQGKHVKLWPSCGLAGALE